MITCMLSDMDETGSDRHVDSVFHRPQRRRRSQPALSRERIVTATIALLDREGASALTMRKVAAELGVHATSLYWHVDRREDLVDLAVDEILAEAASRLPSADLPWDVALKETAHRFYSALTAHTWAAEFAGSRPLVGPNAVALSRRIIEALAALGTPEDIARYVEYEFANYYVETPPASFAAQVWTNNAWVSAQAIIFGVFLGLPTLWVLLVNAIGIGSAGGMMFALGRGDVFFALILPHGLLELTAVFVAGGVGLRIGWSIISPGDRTRMRALGEEARAAIAVALGLVVVLFISGLIEGLVTGWITNTWAAIGIGVVAEVLFFLYVFTVGRKAYEEGETGDIADAPAAVPVA